MTKFTLRYELKMECFMCMYVDGSLHLWNMKFEFI